jgi:hypothetical protein
LPSADSSTGAFSVESILFIYGHKKCRRADSNR